MDFVNFVMALSPILVVLVGILGFKQSAKRVSPIALVWTLILAFTYFNVTGASFADNVKTLDPLVWKGIKEGLKIVLMVFGAFTILNLLRDINRRLGVTVVIITHEMAVVQEICSHVAIIDAGELAEHGTVEEVFSRPQSAAARKLVFMVDPKAKEMSGKRCIRIVFTENSSFEPVIANMVLECKAPVNILLADTKDIGGIAHGQMILQLPEDEMAANKMIHYLQERKLEVEELKDYVG